MVFSESASTGLGTAATVCWCVQLIPQIWYNWKRKDCTGLSPFMMASWIISAIPFAIYFCIMDNSIVLQVQPHLFMAFCTISFIQTCYYPPVSMNRLKIVLLLATIVIVDVAFEIGFILWLRPLYKKGTTWPNLIFGISATVLLIIGLLPPYFELAKRKGKVIGINFIFLFVDSLGAWLSIASVIVGTMDIMGIVLYSTVAAMEVGIFISHFIWCCRFKWFSKDYVSDDEDEVYKPNNDIEDCMPNDDQITVEKSTKEPLDKFARYLPDNAFEEINVTLTDEYELRDIIQNKNNSSSNVHAIHGIIMKNRDDSSGSIKI